MKVNDDDYSYCMATMCLEPHVIINGLRHHKDTMSDSKRGYDYPLHNIWLMSQSPEDRREFLEYLQECGVPTDNVISATINHKVVPEPGSEYTITWRGYARNRENDIVTYQDNDGDIVAIMDTYDVRTRKAIPQRVISMLIDAGWCMSNE